MGMATQQTSFSQTSKQGQHDGGCEPGHTVYMKVAKSVNPQSSHHKEEVFLVFSGMTVVIISNRKSNHNVHLKPKVQHCKSVTSE